MYDELIKDPDAYLRGLFDAGWLDEWAENDIETLRKALHTATESDPRYMVFTLSEYSLDPEGFHISEDYKGLLISLCRNFDIDLPTEDVITDISPSLDISVKTPEGIISYSGTQEDDWLQDDFFDFINEELLPALGEEKIFFVLPPAEAQVEIVFQYPEVIEAAMENGVLPDDEYFVNL